MIGMPITLFAILSVAGSSAPTEALDSELKRDVVLKALVDELERNQRALKLDDAPPPYFIEYQLVDGFGVSIAAELGAVVNRDDGRSRWLRTDVRVGSYDLDNSNFRGSRGGGGARVPIENDEAAIRQALWWSTDRQYKEAVEQLAEKSAFMAGRVIEDKPPDFSRESANVYFEAPSDFKVDQAPLESVALAMSAVFRAFPAIQESSVRVTGVAGQKYLINTEGTRLRTAHRRFSIVVNAKTQADDGMELSTGINVDDRDWGRFPQAEELTKLCRDLADQLVAARNAPILENYTGPVLFEPEAAAALFVRYFAPRFAGGQRPVGNRTHPDDFANKLNKRILPRTVSVSDDPTVDRIGERTVMGSYVFDDQGVKARPLSLVENGRLVALLMARNPSKEFANSTGHGRSPFGPRASWGSLSFKSSQPLDAKTLREELLEAVADEGLPFGLRIGALGAAESGDGRGQGGTGPLLMFKVFPDGREEMVRGAEFARVDLKAFKRILAVGDTPYVLNSSGPVGQTVCVPALLFEELDLARVDRDYNRPPILLSPVAQAVEGADGR